MSLEYLHSIRDRSRNRRERTTQATRILSGAAMDANAAVRIKHRICRRLQLMRQPEAEFAVYFLLTEKLDAVWLILTNL